MGNFGDAQRAANLKETIARHLDAEIDRLYTQSNIGESAKILEGDEVLRLLYEALGKDGYNTFSELFRIKKDYFEQK